MIANWGQHTRSVGAGGLVQSHPASRRPAGNPPTPRSTGAGRTASRMPWCPSYARCCHPPLTVLRRLPRQRHQARERAGGDPSSPMTHLRSSWWFSNCPRPVSGLATSAAGPCRSYQDASSPQRLNHSKRSGPAHEPSWPALGSGSSLSRSGTRKAERPGLWNAALCVESGFRRVVLGSARERMRSGCAQEVDGWVEHRGCARRAGDAPYRTADSLSRQSLLVTATPRPPRQTGREVRHRYADLPPVRCRALRSAGR